MYFICSFCQIFVLLAVSFSFWLIGMCMSDFFYLNYEPKGSILFAMKAGRPKEFNPDHALHAIMMLFWEKGYCATSIRDLQRVTGLSKSSLYKTFSSKQKLLLDSISLYREVTIKRVLSYCTDANNFHDLENFLARHFEAHAMGCFMLNLVMEFSGSDNDLACQFNEFREQLENILANAAKSLGGNKNIQTDNHALTHLLNIYFSAAIASRTADLLGLKLVHSGRQ